ncbi:MAG: RluA family pseudouridine synthase [Phycisphaerales bacterium]|nr:RluA family pseudouridine synthase [Planctomycetota bacterium]MCH8508747.1 RluA family pseudouridine synthase [Phycisphaerales bacterium]
MSEIGTNIEPNPRVTFRTLHEDEHLLIVEKMAGTVTVPGVGHQHDTLLNGLYEKWGERLRQLGLARDHGLVHRLDQGTSGVLAVALTHAAYDGLRAAFEQREVRKYYWAVTLKAPREPEGVVRQPIEEVLRRKNRYTSERIARPSASGKSALTAYRVLQASELGALIEARPVTGRLHQIRVHMDLIGAPVLGDPVYGPHRSRGASKRLALHAHRLSLAHPVTGETLDVRTAFPKDLRGLLKRLELSRPDEGEGE